MAPPRKTGNPKDSTIGALTPDALITLNMFVVRHLVRLYGVFDGDLLEAIVLGEVAHHNLSAYMAQVAEALRTGTDTRPSIPERRVYLPTNAFSIAQATGIPRQTVRRKVKALVARGWLLEDKGALLVSPAPFEHFRTFNAEFTADVLSTFNMVLRLTRLAETSAPARATRSRR